MSVLREIIGRCADENYKTVNIILNSVLANIITDIPVIKSFYFSVVFKYFTALICEINVSVKCF